MRGLLAAMAFCISLCAGALLPGQALADRVVARVSISSQTMKVYHEGRHLFTWTVSTAKPGKVTPTGVFIGAEALSKHHRSRLYNNAPMPFAIFYDGNYAIHGTDQIKRLGAPASNGCVRLHPENAAILFQMVKAEGKDNLRIEIAQ